MTSGDGRILILSLANLGDGVCLSPCIAALHEALPDRELALVAKPPVCALYAEDGRIKSKFPLVVPWFPSYGGKHDGWGSVIKLATTLRRGHFDTVLNTIGDVRSNLFARLAGAGRLIVCSRRHGDFLATEIVANGVGEDCHEADRLMQLASAVIGRPISPKHLSITISETNRIEAATLLSNIGCANDTLIGLHPGANVDFKEWGADRFIRVGKEITKRFGCRALILGASGREQQLADRVAEEIGTSAISLAGKTGIGALLGVLERCKLYIGNDSGPMHMAAAAGCPVVAVFGGGNPLRFGPYLGAEMCRIISPYGMDRWEATTVPQTMKEARAFGIEALSRIDAGIVVQAACELWKE